MTLTLTWTIGLPGSGKSYWAVNQAHAIDGRITLVNKDDIRRMLHDGRWSKANEKLVVEVRDAAIIAALRSGQHVIVHDTNFAPVHEQRFNEIAKMLRSEGRDVKVEMVDFRDVPLKRCIEQDLKRQHSVGEQVIRKMYRDFMAEPPETKKVEWDDSLPTAIIVDVDGTIAKMVRRGPYEFDRVSEDVLNGPVAEVVHGFKARNPHGVIIVLSARDDSCEQDTRHWLTANDVPYDMLFMRETGDKRKDAIVKDEIFETHIRGKYNIEFCLDDRDQVVALWRSKGLTCLQVEYGDF